MRLPDGAADVAGLKLTTPIPPTIPKPSNILPASLRHKFVNHSVSSLPTNCATRDNLAEEDVEEDNKRRSDDFGSDSSSDSGVDSDSDLGDGEQDHACDLQTGVPTSEPEGHVDAHVLTAGRLSALQEEASVLMETSSADSHRASVSDIEDELSLEDVEEFDECEDWPGKPPLLDLEAGIQPPWELPRCPPAAWLTAAGFDVAGGSRGFDAAPVAPVCGERPKQYLNLFCRQMLARQKTSDLTVGGLHLHDSAMGVIRHTDPMPLVRSQQCGRCSIGNLAKHGDWLQAFIARARAEPLREAAGSIVGSDLGESVANFLDSLSDRSNVDAEMDDQDVPNGVHVTGQKMTIRPVHRGRGRVGWTVENDTAISTPGRSQSPPPRREPQPLPFEAPTPPLIPAPGQDRQQMQRAQQEAFGHTW